MLQKRQKVLARAPSTRDPTRTFDRPDCKPYIDYCPVLTGMLFSPQGASFLGGHVERRKFISILGGATAWPFAARAQSDRMRRIGMLMAYAASDLEAQLFVRTFVHGLSEFGWTDGKNLQIDFRWAAGDIEQMRVHAKQLVAANPDLIVANTTPVTAALHRETRTIPIVFVIASDPVGDGFIESLARPGGNITGFIQTEAAMGGKLLELLKEAAPQVRRAALIFNPDTAAGRGNYFRPSFEAAARALAVQPTVHNDAEVEAAITALAREAGGGLVVMSDPFTRVHRGPIIALAAQYKVPAVHPTRIFALEGGLMAFGPSNVDLFRRAPSYVDRILRGANPADLPAQVPTKFELVVNLRTAKGLSLEIPPAVIVRADEVIE
jgi:putative ABC transport system substrate-binding protein